MSISMINPQGKGLAPKNNLEKVINDISDIDTPLNLADTVEFVIDNYLNHVDKSVSFFQEYRLLIGLRNLCLALYTREL